SPAGARGERPSYGTASAGVSSSVTGAGRSPLWPLSAETRTAMSSTTSATTDAWTRRERPCHGRRGPGASEAAASGGDPAAGGPLAPDLPALGASEGGPSEAGPSEAGASEGGPSEGAASGRGASGRSATSGRGRPRAPGRGRVGVEVEVVRERAGVHPARGRR